MAKNKLRTRNGFTLVELLVVLVILAVLAAAIIPTMLGFIDESKRKLCEVNRLQINRYYQMMKQTHEPLGETVTLQDVFDGIYLEVAPDIPRIKCPSGGTYTVEGEAIVCSVLSHGGNGSSGGEPPDEPSGGGSVLPGTNIPLVPGYWPTQDQFTNAWDVVSVVPGGIFEYEGLYYVVTKDTQVNKQQAASGHGGDVYAWFNTQKITGKIWDMDDYQGTTDLNGVARGDILDAGDGKYYVFQDGGSVAHRPEGNNQWYLLP